MMGLIITIGYVLIIVGIVRTIMKNKNARKEHWESQSVNESSAKPVSPETYAPPVNMPKSAQPVRSVDSRQSQGTTMPVNTVDNSVSDTSDDVQVSTTEYLAEKARLDQIDHAREKREEILRLRQKSGGLLPAERLYDGDSVPAGKHCVICGYCAAENLVPNGAARKYSCYFCREPL